jgi:GT2 family glycosyltransferase
MAARSIGPVSAVVCNYDGEAYLEECLASVLAQEGVDDVWLVDDASQDGSLALVRARFPAVQVLALPVNSGPCAARNAGMRAARHRFVLAVDNDAVLQPGVLARLVRALEERPRCVAAQPRSLLYAEPGRVHYDGGAFHYAGLLSLRNFHAPLCEARGQGVVPSDALIAIAPLVDREALLAAGGYDERFFYLAEDFDLALRLRLAGHEIVAVEEAHVLHKGGTAGLSFRGGGYPRRRAFLHSRNRWMILAKCYSGRSLLALSPGILLYELAFTLFALLQGNLGAHLAGKWSFLRGLRATLADRRAVQAARRVPDRELLVGGPLTLSPSLVASGPARALARALDACLGAWWRLARPLCG